MVKDQCNQDEDDIESFEDFEEFYGFEDYDGDELKELDFNNLNQQIRKDSLSDKEEPNEND